MKKRSSSCLMQLFGGSALAGAMGLCAGGSALAGPSVDPATSVGEVVVTASRRAQDVTTIPYNISSVSADQIQRTGIASLEDLSAQIPNLNLNSAGAANIGAERPVMRGLNASASDRPGQALEQSPVALYLGNVPTGGDFPIDDVARVEVLRGPQGTLYGAGSLGGTIRIIPQDPRLKVFEGSLTGSVGGVDHSGDADYSIGGIVNVPIGDTFALRIDAKRDYQAGFIDQIGVFKRTSNSPLAPPELANPADPAGSPAKLYNIANSNWTNIDSGRISAKWAPTDRLKIVGAYNIVQYNGWGSPTDNPHYQGGPDPLAPSVIYPATHDDQLVLRDQLPYDRRSDMASLDISYDAGFATLSTTTSYYQTKGDTWYDSTYGTLALPASYLPYYTGTPANPRFNSESDFHDSDHNFTQEVRIVSSGVNVIDYTLGAYYQDESRDDDWLLYLPGSLAQTVASGCNCVSTGPNDIESNTDTHTKYSDTAVFGELTWNVTDKLHITGGARFFWDTFQRRLYEDAYLFGLIEQDGSSTAYHSQTFKVNVSYSYAAGQQVYATFSQGFRRGGANGFPQTGPLSEPSTLRDFKPDTVDNYEVGFKGRLPNGLRYSIDGFYDDWKDPQFGTFTTFNAWPVVLNGKQARSAGVELEVDGPITHDLSYSVGYAFAQAVFTQDFCLPAGEGGGVVQCAVEGHKGENLPGAPQHTGSADLIYSHTLGDGDVLGASVNINYKGPMLVDLPSAGAVVSPNLPGYWLANANVSLDHGPWRVQLYVHNLFNTRGLISKDLQFAPLLGSLQLDDSITRPISGGLQIGYHW